MKQYNVAITSFAVRSKSAWTVVKNLDTSKIIFYQPSEAKPVAFVKYSISLKMNVHTKNYGDILR